MQELGAGVIMGLFQFGSLPHALATKNIELFCEDGPARALARLAVGQPGRGARRCACSSRRLRS